MNEAAAYELDVVRTLDGFDALEPEWTRLYEGSAPRNPFLSFEWNRACWRHLCGGYRPFIVTLREGGRLVGVAPLRVERRLGFRVLRFIGNLHSDYLGFLHPAGRVELEGILLEGLARFRKEWDVAVLRQLTDHYTSLHRTGLPGSLRDRHTDGSLAPFLSFDGDWEALCKTGPSWLREMRKDLRRFQRDGGVIECLTGEEAARRMDQAVEIEANSWKMLHGEPSLQKGPADALIRAALPALAPRGEMALWLATMGGTPVAFHLTFRTPEKIGSYLCGYHAGYRKYSPGAVVMFQATQAAWEAGVREYDFMNGAEAYKLERCSAARPLRYRAFFPAGLRGELAFALLVCPRWWAKDFRPAHRAFHGWLRLRAHPRPVLRAALASLRRLACRVPSGWLRPPDAGDERPVAVSPQLSPQGES